MSPKQAAVSHPSVKERTERGRLTRKEVPRSAHADWEPAAQTAAIPSTCSRNRRATRVPELVPIRYGRMLVSPFTFYRGAAGDHGRRPRGHAATGLQTQLCGDAHLSNFGVFAAPDRTLVFDVNDFDETLPGPFEWDLKRLAASFAVAGPRPRLRQEGPSREPTVEVGRSYREAMRDPAPSATSTSGTRGSTSRRSSPGWRRSRPRSSSGAQRRTSPRRVRRTVSRPSRS